MLILKRLFRSDYAYKRTGIMLMDLTPENRRQRDLFSIRPTPELDKVRDLINQRYGRDHFKEAKLISENKSWGMNQQHLSKPYTTSWLALPVAS